MGPPRVRNVPHGAGRRPECRARQPIPGREVDGLRVVDASIFPRIPGYFIVTNIYMASEKAADVIAEDADGGRHRSIYPHALHEREVEALSAPRAKQSIRSTRSPQRADRRARRSDGLEPDVTGLALSGGGIRSATFNLGVLQALARGRWLRRIDFLSTVSGGGYIGSFLGRWFDRLRPQSEWGGTERQPAQSSRNASSGRSTTPSRPQCAGCGKHGNYIAPPGAGDEPRQLGGVRPQFLQRAFRRGAAAVGASSVSANGDSIRVARAGKRRPRSFSASDPPEFRSAGSSRRSSASFYSPWFVVFELILCSSSCRGLSAYWIVSQDGTNATTGSPLLRCWCLCGGALVRGDATTGSACRCCCRGSHLSGVRHVESRGGGVASARTRSGVAASKRSGCARETT